MNDVLILVVFTRLNLEHIVREVKEWQAAIPVLLSI